MCDIGGWAIPRKDLIKKSPIGKGEFGGELVCGEGGKEGDREEGRREGWVVMGGRAIDINFHHFSTTEVWLGEYQGGKVAIKMLKDLRDAKASQLFLREASVMT